MTAVHPPDLAPGRTAAGQHEHETRIIRWFSAASVVAAATWLVLWFVPLASSRSGYDFGSCGSVANPTFGPCRGALEEQAMFAGLALGAAAFSGIMAFAYAKTRGPLRDGVQPAHWFLAGIGGVMLMCAWLGITMGNIDALFA